MQSTKYAFYTFAAACSLLTAGCHRAVAPVAQPVTTSVPSTGRSGAVSPPPPSVGSINSPVQNSAPTNQTSTEEHHGHTAEKLTSPDSVVLVQTAAYKPTIFGIDKHEEPAFTAKVHDYTVSPGFSNIRNWRQFSRGFDTSEQDMLKKNLFLVLDGDRHQMSYIYEENGYPQNEKSPITPSFITTDALLHTYHVFFDYLLRSVETRSLSPAASMMTRALLEGSLEQYATAQESNIKRAALHNIADLLVPAHALQCDLGGLKLPDAANSLASSEWKLIHSHQGSTESPIFGYKIDYSQFVPRGHYTHSETLKQYFIAMMWYGSVPMLIRDKDGKTLPDGLRQAALLGELFDKGSAHSAEVSMLWKRIAAPTSFLGGDSDDYTPMQFLAALKPAAGGARPEMAAAKVAGVKAMIAAAEKTSPSRMVNGISAKELGVKLMGQRFVLDGYVMQNLVLPEVGTMDQPRNHPMGLDVMAAIGNSEPAKDLLDNLYNQNQFLNYDAQLVKMKDHVEAIEPTTWTSNAYYGWLDVLRRVVAVKDAGYPAFMRSTAWVDKSLNTALASWAELRHDTILYSKQTAVEAGGEGGDDSKDAPPTGYVEPDIRTYARLRSLLRQISGGLQRLGMLDDDLKEPCKRFDELLGKLMKICKEELANQRLTPDEYETLRQFGDTMDSLNVFMSEVQTNSNGTSDTETSLDADRDMAVIADIHTDLFNKKALEEGIGHANIIYGVFPAKGKLWIGRGAVFSYYEFEQPASDRLTDDAWRAMLKSHSRVQPAWITSFQMHKPAPHAKLKVDDTQLDNMRVGGSGG